ncbi:hypothetical protein [Streptomyces poriferorum]|uniref:Uncharacterized protein n=1 Tax=Streptomyces poriferorum TaxID=2798799 RepID=A0ABY9IRB7_9ACTN|nr:MULTISPECIES: hypothetical protein [unclassified Streptomyces]MDP5313704.1 hypothetical protein [Streptomyces sp. Alt4]WLQ57334.1 hypothetical protein P8A19_18600 [Streptomyces sp. Alt2]
MALHQAALPGWEDWDVAHAWGGDEELRRLLRPDRPTSRPPRRTEFGSVRGSCVGICTRDLQ